MTGWIDCVVRDRGAILATVGAIRTTRWEIAAGSCETCVAPRAMTLRADI
jgi:hypothetical protein